MTKGWKYLYAGSSSSGNATSNGQSFTVQNHCKKFPKLKWFKELPFDTDEMEETIITKKIENLLSVMNFDLTRAEDKTTFESLFDFG